MLDTVFVFLNTYSHKDPNFEFIKTGLDEHKLDEGEIDDCLKKLHKDGYLYFMDNKKDNQKPDVAGETYHRGYNYLITFDGKLFLKNVGGYRKQKEIDDLKIEETKNDLETRRRNDRRLVVGTFLVAVGAIGLIAWEVYKTFLVEHPDFHGRAFYLPDYLLGITTGISLLLAIQYIILRKKKSK